MQGPTPTNHTDFYSKIPRVGLEHKQTTLIELCRLKNEKPDDYALLLSKLIECKYYRQTDCFNNDRQNACWQFILDFALWPKDDLTNLMELTKNDGWDIVLLRKFPSEFKELLSNLSADDKQKILSQFTALPKDEQEKMRNFLIDATGEHWPPLVNIVDDRIFTNEIQTNPEKAIFQLVERTIQNLSTSFLAPTLINSKAGLVVSETLMQHFNLIEEAAREFVRDVACYRKHQQPNDSELIKEFRNKVLLKIIKNAVDNNIDVAMQFLTSTPFNSDFSVLTSELIFSYCIGVTYKDKAGEAAIRMFTLLKNIKADFNCFNFQGNTPLILASEYAAPVSVLKSLIDAGADVNKAAKGGEITPLSQAVSKENVTLVEQLLTSRANAKDPAVCKALNNIITKTWVDSKNLPFNCQIIESLVKAGTPVETKDRLGNTPLKNAVLRGHWPFTELLIRLGATIYPEIFLDAIASNNEKCARHLIENYSVSLPTTIPYYTPNPLHTYSLSSGYPIDYSLSESNIELEMFQLCLSKGMSANKFSLANEVVLKTHSLVKHFLSQNQDLNVDVSNRWQKTPGNSPGAKGWLFAHFAASCATRESLALLIHAGLDIHARDRQGLTPLHYAAAYANPEAVKLLIFAGVDIDAVDNDGMAPLHWAVQHDMAQSIQNLPCARILLYAGAKHDLKDNKERTPFGCLYRGGFSHKEQAQWDRAFRETKPRASIGDNEAFTKNLLYRSTLPEDVSLKIEETASQILTPPI